MKKIAPAVSTPRVVRILQARPRLFSCGLLASIAIVALPKSVASQTVTRLIIGWNVGAGIYLALALRMMFHSSHESMRKRALRPDEGRILILAFVVIAAIASLAAIVCELAVAKDFHGRIR